MKSFFLIPVACLIFCGSASAMTDAECKTMWQQADTNKDGVLSGPEAERYSAMMRMANKTMGSDAAINEAIFDENCKADVFKTASVDAGAPLQGANSFTESQAKDRVVAAGFTMPATLTKDDKGIWRGTSTKDGKNVNVAVDYKGNVVSQ